MKIVLFSNTIETQEFFSLQLEKSFNTMGHETFIYDCLDDMNSYFKLQDFIEEGNTVAFSFNFHGLIDDDFLCDGREPVFWNESQIPFVNMVIDHPYYYHKFFRHIPNRYVQISIDHNHLKYMNRFYPNIVADDYVELGGTSIYDIVDPIPFSHRKYDIIFTGNYTNPKNFEQHYKNMERAVIVFYHEIRDRVIASPDTTIEEMAETMIRDEFGDSVTDDYLRECIANLVACDLQVRNYFREVLISKLADAGFKIATFGSGFNEIPCKHIENIEQHGQVSSQSCLDAIAQSKVVLNVMPWFKDGTHDRVYNTMLNGAVSLSDHSSALDREFNNMENIAFYDLKNTDSILEAYSKLINDPSLAESIADSGYNEAYAHHTWAERAKQIEKILLRQLI